MQKGQKVPGDKLPFFVWSAVSIAYYGIADPVDLHHIRPSGAAGGYPGNHYYGISPLDDSAVHCLVHDIFKQLLLVPDEFA